MSKANTTRRYPLNRPDGYIPAVQRYSSVVSDKVTHIQVLFFGIQTKPDANHSSGTFCKWMREWFDRPSGPAHNDAAKFVDPKGCGNIFTVAYWHDSDAYQRWHDDFMAWWHAHDPATLNVGYWLETFRVPVAYRETIAFKEYIRGLSACPGSHIEPMNDSGYWGAARDRIPASAYDRFELDNDTGLTVVKDRHTLGKRIRIEAPKYLAVIRSGVSWRDCGEEQLASYLNNVKPKLDIGMEYLRSSPEDSGCCSLRQVECITPTGDTKQEAYSLGYFLSFGHLERWSHEHPTHLAIYAKAQAERKKYQERLELRTYHEVYILQQTSHFEYLNCHNRTGLLPYFTAVEC